MQNPYISNTSKRQEIGWLNSWTACAGVHGILVFAYRLTSSHGCTHNNTIHIAYHHMHTYSTTHTHTHTHTLTVHNSCHEACTGLHPLDCRLLLHMRETEENLQCIQIETICLSAWMCSRVCTGEGKIEACEITIES